MIKHIKQLLLVALPLLALVNCTKKQDIPAKTNIYPAVPVTVQNAADYRPDPTVTTTLSGTGAIQIVLTIPSGTRTIKEITKVAASTTYTLIQATGNTGFYTTTPIPGSGNTVTFNTSLTEYFNKIPVSQANPAAKANTELTNRFYFLVTLDDNSVIVTQPVRVLVLP